MFWARGNIFLSWSLVRWPLDASGGCLIYLRFLGEEKEWISPKMANLVQTCSKHVLKNLNCGPTDLDGSRLRVLRTSQRSLFGTKTQRDSGGSFVNHQGPNKWQKMLLRENKYKKNLREVGTCWNGMLGLIQSGVVGFGRNIFNMSHCKRNLLE